MSQEYQSFIALFRRSSRHLDRVKEKLQILNDLVGQMENNRRHSPKVNMPVPSGRE
ncbi:hypothetical protein [Sporolactobacillus vineae]|uniref:hypothetical protein n=1 Tax=Sporolactobacillus vineae TaxID=444463 RepID=UPI0002EB5EF7|nr:hypothetical protein [Sporolactobacillus vineae]